jgi:hypothetical protein
VFPKKNNFIERPLNKAFLLVLLGETSCVFRCTRNDIIRFNVQVVASRVIRSQLGSNL